ncbi:thymidylate kinase [Arthroderma uncinatum]|uniref:thymidylate kinase n=1 Tax=Arthroderma uncinatum TaxID=74035 RepID=UPI00144A8BE5|nr:thymidylate kinase [Arthroderma uncinatum]KAF3479512.1 thymidylate kinase [Arthroderma uncinatum]
MALEKDTPAAGRGALVVVEGLDRAGKSTQCASLHQSLVDRGHKAKYIRFPDRTTAIGQMIDRYLRGETQLDDHAVHLLFSANRWEAAKQIRQDISDGITVIVDRYSYSGAVYSAAKENEELQLDWAWRPEIGLPRPDIWFFLNISTEVAAKRGGYGTERYETLNLQRKVGKLFLSLSGLKGNEDMRIIDAGREMEVISREIQDEVLQTMASVDTIGPLRKLAALPFADAETKDSVA